MSHRTFHVTTLGCKVNQYEGQAIRERLAGLGLRETGLENRPDVIVVNTCTVTSRADGKSRKRVRRALLANPEAVLIVTGCAAVTDPERCRAIPGVTHVLTKAQMTRIEDALRGQTPAEGDVFELTVSRLAGHTRAFLKIQDGCDAFCSYCIVPYARGRPRSRPLKDIGEEARRLADSGHREIVITGVHLGRYGKDLNGPTLCDAVREILKTRAVERLRLSSIEAAEITPELLAMFREDPRLCPHLHLPLQSGDDDTLRSMNRGYTAAEFLRVVERIRSVLDEPAVTADVMVGFPGETEARFRNTLQVCRDAAFTRTHVFRYSRRPGTPAADMPQVPGRVVAEREARAVGLTRELALNYRRTFLGRTVAPLVESRRDPRSGMLTGLTERYVTVQFNGPDGLMNSITPVRAVCVRGEAMIAEY